MRTETVWCPAAAQPALPQYLRGALHSANTVELTVDATGAARETATVQRAARADAPTVGLLRDSVTARATRRTRAMRVIRAMRAIYTIRAKQAVRAK